jgi:mediator of RNA polymerase II transcription subunit 13
VATPPKHDATALASPPETTFTRLRKTERQFREASILAALDVETLQLYTFYKKVDIANAKDQKTLLSKFGFVLRSNTCTIAYKTAARLPDLLKPEHNKLYRLFMEAIVYSIKLLPSGDSALQSIGANLYLAEQTIVQPELDQFEPLHRWSLYRIHLQIVPSGHVLLTVAKDHEMTFLRLPEFCQDKSSEQFPAAGHTMLYLAPIGRVARFVGWIGGRRKQDSEKGPQLTPEGEDLDSWEELWKEVLPLWLKENSNTMVEVKGVRWIEAEIAVKEMGRGSTDSGSLSASDDSNNETITWKRIVWPANLCFMLDRMKASPIDTFAGNEDPMKIVQDWIAGTAHQLPTVGKHDHRRLNAAEEDDEPLFVDDGTFDDPEHFQSFGPPAFPASQTIYPTPPDAVMTNTTPGLSAFDGVATTPANRPRALSELVQQNDEDMHDFEEVPTAGGLPGFYDEDLFEEMPDDNFAQGGAGDEPNWDFFDRPGTEPKINATGLSSREEAAFKKDDVAMSDIDDGIRALGNDTDMSLRRQSSERSGSRSMPRPSARDAAKTSHQQSPVQARTSVVVDSIRTAQAEPSTSGRVPLSKGYDERKPNQQSASPQRKSSVFEGTPAFLTATDRDSKYDANGDFWFDPTPATSRGKDISTVAAMFQRPPSTSTESDDSMISSTPSNGQVNTENETTLSRPWAQYRPESPKDISHQNGPEKNSAQQEIQELLALLKPDIMDSPTLLDFSWSENLSDVSHLPDQKFLQIAHITVDQISQTSLIAHEGDQREDAELGNDRLELTADLGGINSPASPSSLFQLINLKADATNGKVHGKFSKLHPNQICLRRVEQPLIASTPILEFWDTLNLQPESGLKSVTAFCLHPNSENVTDGCSNLLQRMTDTYNTCALGTHAIGRLAGLTDDGLIGWDTASSLRDNLHQVCQKVGKAIGMAASLKGTVIVYMISQNDSPTAYLDVCQAFHSLFESFTQAISDKQGVSDIALQVVPQGFVASPEALVIPPQTAYIKLALEVYNRLPPLHPGAVPGAAGPAVVLAKAENVVHLRLTSMYCDPLSLNGPCLHLAYSTSVDGRWISAAWTDEVGHVALTLSYCLRRRGSAKQRPRLDVLKEMYQVSHDLMSEIRGPWRLGVVKAGLYEPTEVQEWRQIASGSTSQQKRCLLMLLSVQLDTTLRVFSPPTSGKLPPPGVQNMYGTPASTPQASITSPDQFVPATPTPGGSSIMNASTPPEPGFDPNIDSDLTLLDPTEESWAVILPYGAAQTTGISESWPALATGLLMKRRGVKNEAGCSTIEISLVSSFAQPSETSGVAPTHELLQDIIKQYRGLVTLGATRGCVDPQRGCVPWHIAMAIRGSHTLGEVM